ncbi:MAG: pyridoxal phosphate-dependent decarboxylase family protein [Acidimicrobiales bacterium]
MPTRRRALPADRLLAQAHDLVARWERRWGGPPAHPALEVDEEAFAAAWAEFGRRMNANFPFFHPRFAGQMLEPPHPVAVAGYVAALLVNPNNHALDGGPVTSVMEKEVVSDLAAMLRLAEPSLGHLTSSGTIANLEALWVGRELRPGTRVVHGSNAHYTHGRMGQVLGVPTTVVPADADGRIDLDAAEAACRQGDVGTLVVTAGTTGLGAVDDVAGALELRDRYGVRVHVDAAYGGFFAVLAGSDQLPPATAASLRAVGGADSVVVDPHKHGLQPYGCGAVLFADPAVGALYRHDSPYTYFTSDELHLGEISLECSRAGAAAAALWLTLQVLPLRPDTGLGPILSASRRAAEGWAARLEGSDRLRLHAPPDLDIVTYLPVGKDADAQRVTAAAQRILAAGMLGPEPVWLSTLRIDGTAFAARHPDLGPAASDVTILRSVLMKPQHELWLDALHARLEALAADAW